MFSAAKPALSGCDASIGAYSAYAVHLAQEAVVNYRPRRNLTAPGASAPRAYSTSRIPRSILQAVCVSQLSPARASSSLDHDRPRPLRGVNGSASRLSVGIWGNRSAGVCMAKRPGSRLKRTSPGTAVRDTAAASLMMRGGRNEDGSRWRGHQHAPPLPGCGRSPRLNASVPCSRRPRSCSTRQPCNLQGWN